MTDTSLVICISSKQNVLMIISTHRKFAHTSKNNFWSSFKNVEILGHANFAVGKIKQLIAIKNFSYFEFSVIQLLQFLAAILIIKATKH